MQHHRENPDTPECAAMTYDNERAVFAAKMQVGTVLIASPTRITEPLSDYDDLWNRWMALGNAKGNQVAARIFASLYGRSINDTDIRACDFYAVARKFIVDEEERQVKEVVA